MKRVRDKSVFNSHLSTVVGVLTNTSLDPSKMKGDSDVTSVSFNAPPHAFPLHFIPNIHRGRF